LPTSGDLTDPVTPHLSPSGSTRGPRRAVPTTCSRRPGRILTGPVSSQAGSSRQSVA